MKKNWYKGLTATAISLAMAGAAVSVPAFAIEYDLANGDVNVGVNAETGSVESWQTTNGTDEFYYALNSETGAWDTKTPGRYQHTQTVTVIDEETKTETVVKKTDNDVIITQSSPETATDNTVTVSGDLKGDDTTAADDVDITIKDVNVDTSDDFIDIAGGTTAEITIEHSTVESDKSIVDIGTGSDITLNLNGENIPNEDGTTGEDKDDPNPDGIVAEMALREGTATIDGSNNFTSYNGLNVIGSDLTINHDGVNNFTGIDGLPLNDNNRFKYTGIYMADGSNVDIIGADADAVLNISHYQNDIAVNSQEKTTLDIETGTVNLTDAQGNGAGTTGNGIFVTHANGDLSITVTGSETGVDEKGEKVYDTHFNANNNRGAGIYYATQAGAIKNTLTVTNADFSASYNGGVGMYLEAKNGENTYTFNNSRVHIDNNNSNGITGQGNTLLQVLNGSYMTINQNRAIGANNTNTYVEDSYFSVSGNGAHGWTNGYFDLINSTGVFSGNRYYGLNITAFNPEGQSSQIIGSNLIAGLAERYNGGVDENENPILYGNGRASIRFGAGALIQDSYVNAAYGGYDWDGVKADSAYTANINVMRNVDVIDSVLISTDAPVAISLYNTSAAGPAYLNINPTSVVTLDSTKYDLFDDWNGAKGYTGRTVVSGGSLQGALDEMHSFYINVNPETLLSEEELAGMSQLELYMYICKNYGKEINAAIENVYIPGSANEYEYAGPVNEDGTILFRFDLNGEVDKGNALTVKPVVTKNDDGTETVTYIYTFIYTDPNTGNKHEYTFRYNTDEEDLNNKGNNAYVWAPVTIIHYNPTNNKLNDADLGTATKDSEDGNTASDYTIFGTTINLAEKDMPSYASPAPVVTVKKEYRDGSIYTTTTTTTSTYGWWVCVEDGKIVDISDKVPGEGATEAEWQAFYDLLNTYVDEETDLLALCGGDTKLAEEITVYGMWKTASEEVITSEPIEFPPYEPDPKPEPKPEPKPDPKPDPKPEEPTPVIPEEPTPVQPVEPVTPSIPDEVIDDIIDEVEQLTSVPQTGAEEEADDYAAAAVSAGVLALAVAGLLRRKHRAE